MKTKNYFLLMMGLLLSFSMSATIYTVNNAAVSPGQFTTVAAAVAAASAGDTLMIAGTDVSHGNVTLDKALTILGPGWVVSGGGISKVAVFGNITIQASNTRIIGVRAINIVSGVAGINTNVTGIV